MLNYISIHAAVCQAFFSKSSASASRRIRWGMGVGQDAGSVHVAAGDAVGGAAADSGGVRERGDLAAAPRAAQVKRRKAAKRGGGVQTSRPSLI